VDVNILARVISKGLKKTGRLMDVETILDDKPRQLEQLLEVIAGQGANIESVQHERDSYELDVSK
jgi:threonine dehydratase